MKQGVYLCEYTESRSARMLTLKWQQETHTELSFSPPNHPRFTTNHKENISVITNSNLKLCSNHLIFAGMFGSVQGLIGAFNN